MYEPPAALEVPSLEAAPQDDAGVVSGDDSVAKTAAPRVVLEVTTADGNSTRVDLAEGRHEIGRAADCGVHIDDRTLSRRHAVVTVEGGAVTIADQDSRNGTFIDDARLMAPVQLRVGVVVTLGDQVTVRLVEP